MKTTILNAVAERTICCTVLCQQINHSQTNSVPLFFSENGSSLHFGTSNSAWQWQEEVSPTISHPERFKAFLTMLWEGLAVGWRNRKGSIFLYEKASQGSPTEGFKRLRAIVGETIGLSESCLEALIKKQVIAQQWQRRLNKRLRMRVRFLTPDGSVVIKLLWEAFSPALHTHTHTNTTFCEVCALLYDHTKSPVVWLDDRNPFSPVSPCAGSSNVHKLFNTFEKKIDKICCCVYCVQFQTRSSHLFFIFLFFWKLSCIISTFSFSFDCVACLKNYSF